MIGIQWKGKFNPQDSLYSICKLLSEESRCCCKEGYFTDTLRKWRPYTQQMNKASKDFCAQFYRLSEPQFGNSG